MLVRVMAPAARIVVVVQLLSHVHLFATPWTAAHWTSLSFTVSWSLLTFCTNRNNYRNLSYLSLYLFSVQSIYSSNEEWPSSMDLFAAVDNRNRPQRN